MNEQEQYQQKLKNLPPVHGDIADLHLHTTCSDGTLMPQQVVDLAVQRGVKVIAITDHDNVDCAQLVQEYAKGKNIMIIPGIEFSCEELEMGFDEVHVLGLFIETKNERLQKRIVQLLQKRREREIQIIENLQRLGFDITFEEVAAKVGVAFGRPHIAKILMEKYPDRFKTTHDVFDNYIGTGKPAYVPRLDKIKVKEAVELIHIAGGIASLAHPCLYKDEDVKEIVEYFVSCGGDAVETHYPYHINAKEVSVDKSVHKNKLAAELAKKHNLLETGGSDFHGVIRPIFAGDCGISKELWERLRKFKENKR